MEDSAKSNQDGTKDPDGGLRDGDTKVFSNENTDKERLMLLSFNKLKFICKEMKVSPVGKTKNEMVDQLLVVIQNHDDKEKVDKLIMQDPHAKFKKDLGNENDVKNEYDIDAATQRIKELEMKVQELSVSKSNGGLITTSQLLEILKVSQQNMVEAMKTVKKEESDKRSASPLSLEKFTDEESDITYHILGAERYMQFNNIIGDQEKYLFLLMSLSTKIAGYVEDNLPYPRTYASLKNYLLSKYDGKAEKSKIQSEVNYFKLDFSKDDIGDQLVKFVKKIELAYKELTSSELLKYQHRMIKSLFTNKNTKVYYFLTTNTPTNIFEYVREIQSVHELDKLSKGKGSSSVNDKGGKKDVSNVTCYNCSQKGHVAKFCKSKKNNNNNKAQTSTTNTKQAKIMNDDSYGEIVNKIFSEYEEEDDSTSRINVIHVKTLKKVEPDYDNYQHIIVQVNDHLAKAFVDSGSGISFVSENLIDEKDIYKVKPLIAKMANNSTMMLNKMVNITINFLNGFEVDTNVFVVSNEILNQESLLIGEDIMHKCGINILYDEGKVIKVQDRKCVSFVSKKKGSAFVKKVKVSNDCEKLKKEVFNDYDCLIPKSKYDVGKGVLECSNIELIDKNVEFKPPTYGIPHAYRERIYKDFKEMEEHGIVEERPAKFIHPLVVIPKKDGELRLCGDFRYVNFYTKSMFLPVSKPYEYVYSLCGYKWYSKIDLKNAYFQVRYPEETIPLMGVKVFDKVYCFKRMAQGGKVSPIQFQCLANNIISDLGEGYHVYIDDFAVCSNSTLEDHVQKVKRLLDKFKYYDMRVNYDKTSIGGTEIEFIGYSISAAGAKIAQKNIDAFLERKEPSTKKDLISFLQSSSYFRGNIPRYAQMTLPLQKIVNSLKFKSSKIEKTSEYFNAVNLVKNAIINPQNLVKAKPGDVIFIESDCSQEAAGGVIYRKSDKNVPEVIMFYSKKLKACKKDRCITYLEMYAINLAVRKFKEILVGHKLVILTDHKPLTGLMKTKETKFLELILPLQEFEYEIKYIQGKMNMCADFFSRINRISENKEVDENYENFHSSENTSKLAEKLFEKLHVRKGHVALGKIKDELIKECYELRMSKFKAGEIVKKMIKLVQDCKTCKVNNTLVRKKRDHASPGNVLELVYLDFAFIDKHSILVAEDGFSRFVWAFEGDQADENVVIDGLEKIMEQCQINIKEIRCDKALVFKSKKLMNIMLEKIMEQSQINIKEIRCDKALVFKSKKVTQFIEKKNIKINFAVAYEHYGNAKVERVIRTLRALLKKMEVNISHRGRTGFKNKLKEACYIYNTTLHSATGVKPFSLIYNYDEKDGKPLENSSDVKLQAQLNKEIQGAPERKVIYRKFNNNKPGNDIANVCEEVSNVTDIKINPGRTSDKRKLVSISGYKQRFL
uniref:RNA-directed DNA polymerase n=1 Tax=Strongyloides papillosus TaxID=174720 RepID=A0A0N5C734_STREA